MRPGQARYSVLMSVYAGDRADWFALALDSMLGQTLPPAQVVVVLDGPVSGAVRRVLAERESAHPGLLDIVPLARNQGLGPALRQGVLACREEWIARMDADDYAAPQRCLRQWTAAQNRDADIVGCDAAEFTGAPGNEIARRVFPETHEELLRFAKRRTPFAHPAVWMRRRNVLLAGNYREAPLLEDYDLFVRMFRTGARACSLAEPLVSVRVNPGFYKRRGGLTYLRTLLAFNLWQYRSGFSGLSDCCVRSCANIVSCALPPSLRYWMYRRILRK